jgi:hypothetical protein
VNLVNFSRKNRRNLKMVVKNYDRFAPKFKARAHVGSPSRRRTQIIFLILFDILLGCDDHHGINMKTASVIIFLLWLSICPSVDARSHGSSRSSHRASHSRSVSTRSPVAENGSKYGDKSTKTGRPKTVFVKGYYRKNGTYVRSYYRSSPEHDSPNLGSVPH